MNRYIKAALFSVVPMLVSPLGIAQTVTWTGKEYIPVPVRRHDLTELEMPNAIASWWSEAPNRIDVSPVPGTKNILSIRALSKNPSQRLFVRGTNGTIYIADISRKLSYTPIVKVRNATSSFHDALQQAAKITPETFMRSMIRGNVMPGFSAKRVNTVIMSTPPYTIVARAVIKSPEMTGIIATWKKDSLQPSVRFNPVTFTVHIPGAGKLRMVSTNKWTLSQGQTATMYLVFTR
ncbi:hypothetical protein [Acidithiobacillus thiooxidans]|jgi:hypothetical protein|uniref:hypothetical protein n=1 Tax=Acidithiobacillus thiooxidans TaxID=930 RepID=UPI0004E23EF1|nr:hypothetical protein [Acidithiobacillus thiooxidans]